MQHTKNVRKLFIASMVTLVSLAYLNEIGLPYFMVALLPNDSWLTPALLLHLIAGIPAIFTLRYFKVPFATGITLFAITESYWISPHVEQIVASESSASLWLAFLIPTIFYLILVTTSVLAYILFNVWNMDKRYKIGAAALIIIATGFVIATID